MRTLSMLFVSDYAGLFKWRSKTKNIHLRFTKLVYFCVYYRSDYKI